MTLLHHHSRRARALAAAAGDAVAGVLFIASVFALATAVIFAGGLVAYHGFERPAPALASGVP